MDDPALAEFIRLQIQLGDADRKDRQYAQLAAREKKLLKAHRKATVRGGQVRFAIRPGGPLHQLTGFVGTHPLLAVYPTLQHALTGRSPIPPGNRAVPGGPRSARRQLRRPLLPPGLYINRRLRSLSCTKRSSWSVSWIHRG